MPCSKAGSTSAFPQPVRPPVGERRLAARLKSVPFKAGLLALLFAGGALPAKLGAAQAPPVSAASGQPAPQSGLYRIAGTVVNSISGEPLYHATVAVLSEEDSHTIAAVESGNDGRFTLDHLPVAKYQLTASKRGYRTTFYDEHELYSSAIVTGPDQETGSLTFRLVPGAILHGTVTTDGGDPVENARVLLFAKFHDGKAGGRITQADTATTDDTGAYELSNLAAGEYLLAVVAEPWYAMHRSMPESPRPETSHNGNGIAPDPPTALDVAYPVTYFDSTLDEASASHITLSGGDRVEVNMDLHAVPALHIRVEAQPKPDGSIAQAALQQTIFGTAGAVESTAFLDPAQTGATFTGVAPGHYVLTQGDPPRSVEFDAAASIRIDPAAGTPTVAVRGTLRTTAGAAAEDCNLYLGRVDRSRVPGQVPQAFSTHGAFTFASVPPGQWQLGANGGKPITITSITVGGRTHAGNIFTVEDRPLSITVTIGQGSTRVQGFARREGKGVAGAMVVLVPADLNALEVTARRDQSDSDGSFSLRNVVPGQYTLVAIQGGWGLDWAEPGVMGRYLPGGIPVTVTDSSGKLVSLGAPVPVQMR